VALDRFAERLEAVQGRLGALEDAENPFAEVSEQLTRLYAQKDATVEAMLGRLAPLEAKLGALEGGLARLAPLAEADPRAAIEGLAARLAELHWAQGEVAAGLAALRATAGEAAPVAELADRLTRLYAQKDAMVEAVLARLQPFETRLAALEGRPWDPDADEARAQAQAIAAQLIAARAASEQISAQTGLFADRLALLEASLPRLSAAQALLMQALEARAAPAPDAAAPPTSPPPAVVERGAAPAAGWGDEPLAAPAAAAAGAPPAPAAGTGADLDEIWSLPRLISLHRK
jgi:prefoldin subunit 5